MKKQILTALTIASMFNMANALGIPTIDVGSIQQSVLSYTADTAEYAKQATRWTQTVAHYKEQVSAYKNELLTKTGVRDLGSAFKDLHQIYRDSKSTYDNIDSFREKVLHDPMGFVNGELKQYYNKYMIFERCNYITNERNKKLCLAESIAGIAEIASLDIAQANAKKTEDNLKKLTDKVQNSKDIKESQDLANTINLQLAALQLENNKLISVLIKQRADEQVREERERQAYEEALDKDLDSMAIFKKHMGSLNK